MCTLGNKKKTKYFPADNSTTIKPEENNRVAKRHYNTKENCNMEDLFFPKKVIPMTP